MDAVLKWVTAILAIWGAVSILVAIFWALVGRKIFRKPPPRIVHFHDQVDPDEQVKAGLRSVLKSMRERGY